MRGEQKQGEWVRPRGLYVSTVVTFQDLRLFLQKTPYSLVSPLYQPTNPPTHPKPNPNKSQNHPRPLQQNPAHQPLRRVLLHTIRCAPNVNPVPSRGLHNRHLIHLRARRRWSTNALYADQSRRVVPHAVLGRGVGEI